MRKNKYPWKQYSVRINIKGNKIYIPRHEWQWLNKLFEYFCGIQYYDLKSHSIKNTEGVIKGKLRGKKKKYPHIDKDRGVTFYSAFPSWLFHDGALYQVNNKLAEGILKGVFIVKPKKKK